MMDQKWAERVASEIASYLIDDLKACRLKPSEISTIAGIIFDAIPAKEQP